uniref:Uncharacterized protein n=1 Tax=Lactuca sativa TaxID=4236 RepID=A0A9R1W633_LACSA|nr:hypothetical protein LSAT_V11C300137040 [Lactuca sativa]
MLLLIFCDEIECKLYKIERKTPLVTMWTTNKLNERQSFEIEAEREKNANHDTCTEKSMKKISTISQLKRITWKILFFIVYRKIPEDNRMEEMIRKFRDIFASTLFSSREKSKTIKKRTEVKADRDEELNKTNISDFDDDKDEGMNTKLVEFLAIKPLQQKFP